MDEAYMSPLNFITFDDIDFRHTDGFDKVQLSPDNVTLQPSKCKEIVSKQKPNVIGSRRKETVLALRQELKILQAQLALFDPQLIEQVAPLESRRHFARRCQSWRHIAERMAASRKTSERDSAKLRSLVKSNARLLQKVQSMIQKRMDSSIIMRYIIKRTTTDLYEECTEYITSDVCIDLNQQVIDCLTYLEKAGLLHERKCFKHVDMTPCRQQRGKIYIQKKEVKILPFRLEDYSDAMWETTVLEMVPIPHGGFRAARHTQNQAIGRFDSVIPLPFGNAAVTCCNIFTRLKVGDTHYTCFQIKGQIKMISPNQEVTGILEISGRGYMTYSNVRKMSTSAVASAGIPDDIQATRIKTLIETEIWPMFSKDTVVLNTTALEEKVAIALIASCKNAFETLDQVLENITLDRLNSQK